MNTAARSAPVVVIGGGLHGCSAALHLARAGVKALVLEKDYVGRHASGVNAGGVRTLTRHLAEVPLSLAARDIWLNIRDWVDDDCEFEQNGQIRVAEDEKDVAVLRERLATMRSLGYTHEEWVEAADVRALVPAITPTIQGGLIAREDGSADPYRSTLAFRRKAQSLGARFLEGVAVRTVRREHGLWRIDTDGDSYAAEVLVNCAGAWADRIAAQAGEPVPLQPIGPMMLVTTRMPQFLDPVVLGTGRPLSFKQRRNGTVLIGGGRLAWVDRDRNATELDFQALALGAQTVCDLFPHMESAVVNRGWAGIEAGMPDAIPVIGPSSTQENLYHAFGFSAHGFQLGPIVGKICADLITRGATALPIEPFAIGRFRATRNGAPA
ncbi:NAD(P)/FAD-dependent oxidoreductase [Parapusillimonas granuli]|uniref:FAD-binding oxidoreductase n=1 Tax=Parapusillimonas granuli TaxID=380911 RepID=A0A853FS42_9BURK|nr:FAD-dependent oxidoreductase [Parapusillimonas granuli]MBB5213859.1 sarcosine oxidase subunit beta [Parapusillimonas granuli]MEB2398938.1 FAD-dependent oxidoreductase [Alcaligenaceae bacterium]NYT48694.1 FAD-binding oxidoreductase [Parapusillimonas granuli]